jgi:hypothetical protein
MIIAVSIIVGLAIAGLLFSSFFSDAGDFFYGFLSFLGDVFNRRGKPSFLSLRNNDDDEWIPAGVRFVLLLTLSGLCGYMTYYGLHKLFG